MASLSGIFGGCAGGGKAPLLVGPLEVNEGGGALGRWNHPSALPKHFHGKGGR